MIAVELTEGQHEIVLSYSNQAFSLGWKISLVCLLAFAAIALITYQPWKKYLQKGKYEQQ